MPHDGPSAWEQWERDVEKEADEARDYVETVESTFVNTTFQLTFAMQRAGTEYDSIMHTEASKSFIGDIFLGIILDVLPGLKVFAAAKKLHMTLTGEVVENAIQKIKGVEEKYSAYVSMAKDVRDRIQSAHDYNSQRQSAASEIQRHLNSRNQTAKEIYAKQLELLQKVTDLVQTSRAFITTRKYELLDGQRNDGDLNIRREITADFKRAGLDGNKRVGEHAFLTLSDKMLYVMLKNYVENNVVIYIDDTMTRGMGDSSMQYIADATALRTRRLSDLPAVRTDSFIKGLDEAKRNKIYKRFPHAIALPSVDGSGSYPGVNTYKDLIKYWKPKVVGTSGRSLQFN